jgi:hypothetical protein
VSDLTYLEVIVVGVFQGVTALFLVSSLGSPCWSRCCWAVGGRVTWMCRYRNRPPRRSSLACAWPDCPQRGLRQGRDGMPVSTVPTYSGWR